MLILNESPEMILSTALLQKNKLKNMKDQLDILLRKRIRLNTEIKILKKAIKNKSKSYQFSLKSKINLEAYDENLDPNSSTRIFIEENLPEVLHVLTEYDLLLQEIEDLLESDKNLN